MTQVDILKELEERSIGEYVSIKVIKRFLQLTYGKSIIPLIQIYAIAFEDGRKSAFVNRNRKSARSTAVTQYDKNGKLREFDSVRDAATANGYSGTDELFKLLKSGKMNVHGHYYVRTNAKKTN